MRGFSGGLFRRRPEPGRNADDHGARRNVAGDDGSNADGHAITDGPPRQDDRSSANVAALADPDISEQAGTRRDSGEIAQTNVVVKRGSAIELAGVSDDDVAADHDAALNEAAVA